jgi:hypothetical protein
MKLLHLPRRLLSVVVFTLSAIWQLMLSLIRVLFGELRWQAPAWLCVIEQQLIALCQWARQHPKRAATIMIILVALTASGHYSWQWYKHLPQPHTIGYNINAPSITDYNQTPPAIHTLIIHFEESAAPLDNIEKTVTKGITLEPTMPGTWRWDNDRTLRFTPTQDWPIGQQYKILMDRKKLFSAGTLLLVYTPTFSTAEFTAKIASTEFYQDPVDSSLKKMVASLRFSHPVDEKSVRKRISLTTGEGLQFRDALKPQQDTYTLTFDAQMHRNNTLMCTHYH